MTGLLKRLGLARQVSRPVAVLVVGMHRSGTSATTGLLHFLGVELGGNLMAPIAGDNDLGFWEDETVVAIHERLLAHLNRSWDSIEALPPGWWQDGSVEPFRQELRDTLRKTFAGAPLWGIKDPRLCRLLPLWLELMAEIEVEPRFVHAIRHPREVARSLARRNAMPEGRALALWLVHVLESEAATRGHRRVFISYDETLADWRRTMGRVGRELRIGWPVSPADAARLADEFLTPALRHHHAAALAGADYPWIDQAHTALAQLARSPSRRICNQLDRLSAQVDAARKLFGPSEQNVRRDG